MSEQGTTPSQGVPTISPKVEEYFALDNAATTWWNPQGHPRYERQHRIIRDRVEIRGKSVIDVATGRGRFAIQYARERARRVVAVDISQGMLDVARENARAAGVQDRIELLRASVDSLPFQVGEFDVINCMEVYVHFPDPGKATQALFRILTPGGVLVANVDDPVTERWYFGWINEPFRSFLSLPFVFNVALVFYFRILPASVRGLFHRWFHWPITWHNPVRFQWGSPKKRFSTAEESIRALKANPNLRLARPRDAIRLMEREPFLAMLRSAGFEIEETIREGRPWQLPYGYMVIARKPAA